MEFPQGSEDFPAQLLHFLGRGKQIRYHHRHHTGSMGGTDAVIGILNGEGIGRLYLHFTAGGFVYIRKGLAAGNAVTAQHIVKILQQIFLQKSLIQLSARFIMKLKPWKGFR